MSNDFTTPSLTPVPIGNLNNVLIDNESTYTADNMTNSFTVKETGYYSIVMNVQLTDNKASSATQGPVVGIWNNSLDMWIARVNDAYSRVGALQTYTLITTIMLFAGDVHSFRVVCHDAGGGGESLTVKAMSQGATGSGPITQVSIKRLK